MRINKYISESGHCSRRAADKLIEDKKVTINGEIAVLGSQVNEGDLVKINDKTLHTKEKNVYIALNKPRGIICTSDRNMKGNIIDFLNLPYRVFTIGRLDKESEGLILLTNDGDIVNHILKSRNDHEKEYIVSVDKPVTDEFLEAIQKGVPILDTITKPAKAWQISDRIFGIILTQGLNRQIRRMCELYDYQVKKLRRIRVMNIELGELPLGKWRFISEGELKRIKEYQY